MRRSRAKDAAQRLAMYRAELSERAALLCRLGYSEKRATARLRANVAWDFEIGTGGRPKTLGDQEIARLVKASFVRV